MNHMYFECIWTWRYFFPKSYPGFSWNHSPWKDIYLWECKRSAKMRFFTNKLELWRQKTSCDAYGPDVWILSKCDKHLPDGTAFWGLVFGGHDSPMIGKSWPFLSQGNAIFLRRWHVHDVNTRWMNILWKVHRWTKDKEIERIKRFVK